MAHLRHLRDRTIACMEWLSLGLGAALLVVTVWDVCGRYVFGTPLFGGPEIVQYLMGAFIFCGLSLVSARDAHVAVDILSPWLSRHLPRLTRLIVGVFTFSGLAIIASQLGLSGLDAYWRGKSSFVLELPVAAILLSYAALCFLAVLLHALPEERR